MTDEIKDYYDAAAGRIADEWYGNNILLPTIKDFLTLFPPSPRILDLGCGPGYESMRMESLGAEVVGVDYSPENIRIARQRCPQCEFHDLDFRSLDSRFGTFDGIFASASLIHITPGEMTGLAGKLQRVLRTEGKLLTIVMDGEGRRERWMDVDGRKMRWWRYLYSGEKLKELLKPFVFIREGFLEKELLDKGWKCFLWRLPD